MMSQLNCSHDSKIISASCDEALLLDMAHLTEEISFSSLYDVNSSQNSLINNPSGIAIPKITRSFKNDIENQIDPNILSLEMSFIKHDIDLEDPLSSFGACGGGEYDDMVGPFSPSLWSPSHDETKPCFMDSGKLDLNQDPTLAELNADPELIGNFDFEDLLLPDEKSSNLPIIDFDIAKPSWDSEKSSLSQPISKSLTNPATVTTNFPASSLEKDQRSGNVDVTSTIQTRRQRLIQESSTLPKRKISTVSTQKEATHKKSTLHELLTQSSMPSSEQTSLPVTISSPKLQLSSSAPPQTCFEQNWGDTSKHSVVPVTVASISDPPSSAQIKTEPVANVSSPVKTEIDSNDEGFDSEPEDTDHYEEFSSDVESVISDDTDTKQSGSPGNSDVKVSKKERFFWQYNVQAKGPKISRLTLSPKNPDPHMLNEVMDPVFSPACLVQGIKHSGKARRGDGNDLTPNPKKLYQIGQELRKLNKVINDLTPVSEMPFNARPRSRKEKNKLASRACRLKKKAQHEANKLKLYGLELEHKKLLYALVGIRKIFVQYVMQHENSQEAEKVTNEIDLIYKANTKTKVAGHTAEFVNAVLEKISKGTSSGLLEEL